MERIARNDYGYDVEKALGGRQKIWLDNGLQGREMREVSVIDGLGITRAPQWYDVPWGVVHVKTGQWLVTFELIEDAIKAREWLLKRYLTMGDMDLQKLWSFESDIMGHSIETEFPDRWGHKGA